MFGRRPTTPLEDRLSYRFRRIELLELALTHRSQAHEEGETTHNERLEFLGDAVLGLVAADWLYRRHPDLPEGDLSKRKSHLVARPELARQARRLVLGELLRLGVGEERSGGREKDSILADAAEAVFGAIYVDGGFTAVRKVIERHLEEAETEPSTAERHFDAKTRLQEIVQGRGWALPAYSLVDAAGPDHDKTFVVECTLADGTSTRGSGRSKKHAEQAAAAASLARLEG